MGTVKQDANGVPEEWTLLHAGVNRLVKNGKDYELRLSVEDLDAIAIRCCEMLTAEGFDVPVINSINVEGGLEKNKKLYAKYRPLIKWL